MFDFLQYDFMIRALIAALAISILAPLVGIFLVVRRYSMLADTLAHVSLLGIAASSLFGVHPVAGALFASCLAALGMEKVKQNGILLGESILALFLSGSLALAVILFGLTRGLNANIVSYLFGSITTVNASDVWIIACFGMAVLCITLILFKRFFLVSFDENLSRASGLRVHALNNVLMILAAITVSLAMKIVGILLVGALMVIPVITAIQYKKSFAYTTVLAILISVISAVSGLILSFYFDLPSGGVIVAITLLFFIASLLVNKK